MKTLIIGILSLTMATGCSMFQKEKIEVVYPSDIHEMCQRASDQAQAILAKHGMATSRKYSVRVVKQVGTRKVRGMWIWQDPTYGWIGGYKGNGVIVVGCSPNGDEVSFGVLVHEFGHYWKMSNGYGHAYNDHDPYELFGVR